MKETKQNNEYFDNIDNFFSDVTIKWKKSKDEIWNQTFDNLVNSNPAHAKKTKIIQWVYKVSVAAVITLLIGVSSVMYFYTETIDCPRGKHLSKLLPDQSEIKLNSGSQISYKPYLWWLKRNVKLKGEAFFKVTKGKKFDVISSKGVTQVLGTSFNIFARGNKYKVTCITGKVRVISKQKNDTSILNPNQEVYLLRNGKLKKNNDVKTEHTTAWIDNKFVFTSTPLNEVFKEIERQYNITIKNKNIKNLIYTGNFSKNNSIEDVLNLVCTPMNITFVKKGKFEYHIIQNK